MGRRASVRSRTSSTKHKSTDSRKTSQSGSLGVVPLSKDVLGLAVALYDYHGVTTDELDFKCGDKFEILSMENSDWWFARLTTRRKPEVSEGYIPTTYVRRISPNYEQSPDDSEGNGNLIFSDDKASEYESSTDDSSTTGSDEESDEEPEADGVNAEIDGEFIPTVSWRSDRKHNHRHHRRPSRKRLAAPDPLKGFEPLPRGFRFSTLGKTLNEGTGLLSSTLIPRLTRDGLMFRDLFWDYKKERIRRRQTSCTVAFSLLDARYIPVPGQHVHIVGRVVRLALFDKKSILSNIHSVPAVHNSDVDHIWKFSTKASLLFPKDDNNTVFCRVNEVDVNLCVLFEFCLIVRREGTRPGATEELSCGWGLLPLFTADGGPLENKNYEVKLFGGTPFEKNVLLHEEAPKSGFLQSLIHPNTAPRLNVRVWKLAKAAVRHLKSELPDTIISSLAAVPVLALYRQALAERLVSPENEGPLSTTADTVLSLVLALSDRADLLCMLSTVWEQTWRDMTRQEKRSFARIKAKFAQCLLKIWPLNCFHGMTSFHHGFIDNSEMRQSIIRQYEEHGIVDSLGRNPTQLMMQPFNTNEMQYDCLRALATAR